MSKSVSLSFGSYAFFVLILAVFCQLSCASITKDNRDRNSDWRYLVYDPESGLCGYIDSNGEMAIQPKFEDCQELFNGLGYVVIDGKYGYIDKHGKIVIPAQFEYADEFSDGIAEVKLEGKEGFINENGEFLFMAVESAWYHGFREGLALARYSINSWGFIDKTGKQIIGPYTSTDLDCYDDFSEGLVRVETKEKYGYMNKDEEMVIEPQFDFARSFSKGLAIVGNRDKDSGKKAFYVINKKGEIIAGPNNEWDMIREFSEGLAEVKIGDRYGYVNTDLEVVISPIYDVTRGYFKGGIVEVIDEENGINGYIDKNNTWVWKREQGRHSVFMFRETTRDKIAQSIAEFGAIPLERKIVFLYPDPVKTGDMASPTWVYPDRENNLLFIGLEEDLKVAYISMTYDVIGEWHEFEEVLYKNANPPNMSNVFRSSAVLYVYIEPGRDAENALRAFALHMLGAHPGIVADFYHDHAWTLEEIKKDMPWNSIHFLRPHRREE